MSHFVFVYGTLKRGQPNHHKMTNPENGKATFVCKAKTVEKYPLVVATKFNIPFMLDKPGHGHCVAGEVYRIDDRMLQSLDDLEQYPTLYTRHPIQVEQIDINDDDASNSSDVKSSASSEGPVQESLCYYLQNYKEELLDLPSEDCYDAIRNPRHEWTLQHIVGELYRIDDAMLNTLDALEHHPTRYRRQSVEVKQTDINNSEGKSTAPSEDPVQECMCYVLQNYKEELLDLPLDESFDANGNPRHKYTPIEKRNMTNEELRNLYKQNMK